MPFPILAFAPLFAPPAMAEPPDPNGYRAATFVSTVGFVAAVPATMVGAGEAVFGGADSDIWYVIAPVAFGAANGIAIAAVPTARARQLRASGVQVPIGAGRMGQAMAVAGAGVAAVGTLAGSQLDSGAGETLILTSWTLGGAGLAAGTVCGWIQGAVNESHAGSAAENRPSIGLQPAVLPGGTGLALTGSW